MEKFASFGFVVEIAASGRWAAKLDPSLSTLAKLITRLINHPKLMAWKWLAASRDLQRRRIVRTRRFSDAMDLSWSRLTRSMTGFRPKGRKANPTEHSASP